MAYMSHQGHFSVARLSEEDQKAEIVTAYTQTQYNFLGSLQMEGT